MNNLPVFDTNHIGTPIYWPDKVLPGDNYVWVMGQEFDKLMFTELAKRYPSGRLPDPRWDFFRIVGTEETALTKVEQSVQPLSFAGNALPKHGHTLARPRGDQNYRNGSSSNAWWGSSKNLNESTSSVSAGTPSGTIRGTGAETRPKNMLWHCIMRVK